MNVLIIGSGGREHALAWKIAQSPRLSQLFIAPGNGGTAAIAENVPIGVMDFDRLVEFAKKEQIGLTIVGPDDPLAGGIVDRFRQAGLKIFGPNKAAAELESSKAFSKQFLRKYGIPTADFEVFTEFDPAWSYVERKGVPIVVKASGLALGKGVFVCHSLTEAKSALKKILIDKEFGEAGSQVVVEEFLEGPEVSIHAICDGSSYKLFPPAQDHKPVFDDDRGPNTGGMGTYVPVPGIDESMMGQIEEIIVKPTLAGMKREGRPFTGLLYPGLKMTKQGPKVLEFNARFGDPETQSYMRLLKTDLLQVIEACVERRLAEMEVEWSGQAAVCIVLASGGYPGSYQKALSVSGIETAGQAKEVVVFHAGTAQKDGQIVTAGGRVLGITAAAESLPKARDMAYEMAKIVDFEGKHYRTDIGDRFIN